MTKGEYERLRKQFGRTSDPDGLGCISSKEWKVLQSYKKIFGEELPIDNIDNISWEQLEYAYREGRRAIAGERGVVTLEELLDQEK